MGRLKNVNNTDTNTYYNLVYYELRRGVHYVVVVTADEAVELAKEYAYYEGLIYDNDNDAIKDFMSVNHAALTEAPAGEYTERQWYELMERRSEQT